MPAPAVPRPHTVPKHLIAAAAARVAERDRAWAAGEPVPRGPHEAPCSCGAGLMQHQGEKHHGAAPSTGCTRYRPDRVEELIAEAFVAQNTGFAQDLAAYERATYVPSERPPNTWSVRVSDTAACARAVGYRNLRRLAELHPDTFAELHASYVPAPSDRRAARMGTFIHDGWQRIQRFLYPWRLFEMPVEVEGLDGTYRPDDFDPVTCRLRSTKTAGTWRWETVGVEGPAEAWLDAEALYAVALEAAGHRVVDIAITVIERADGADVSYIVPFDDDMRERAERARGRLLGVMTQLDMGILPERERSGPSTDPICQSCPARRICWNMDAAEDRGRSPESVTVLGLDPDTSDIEWAITNFVTLRKMATKAKNAADEAKILVAGITIGVYGDGEIAPPSKQRLNAHQYVKNILAVYDMADGERPPVEQIPVPYSDSNPQPRLRPSAARAAAKRRTEERPTPTTPEAAAS